MFSHGMQAYSSASPAAAVAAAVAEASADFGGDAKSVHIIVSSVFKVGEGWNAIVRIIVEPNLEKELEKNLQKEEDKKPEENLKQDGEAFLRFEMPEPHEPAELIAHVHFPVEYEPVYSDFIRQDSPIYEEDFEPELYVHIIEPGSLWKAVEEHPLDIEFYEAAISTRELERKQTVDSPKLEEKPTGPDLIKKPKDPLKDLEFIS